MTQSQALFAVKVLSESVLRNGGATPKEGPAVRRIWVDSDRRDVPLQDARAAWLAAYAAKCAGESLPVAGGRERGT